MDNVHTFRRGLPRRDLVLLRIPHVSAGSQCLKGLECGSSPTSGTLFSQVRGLFVVLVCTELAFGSSDGLRCFLADDDPMQVFGVAGPEGMDTTNRAPGLRPSSQEPGAKLGERVDRRRQIVVAGLNQLGCGTHDYSGRC